MNKEMTLAQAVAQFDLAEDVTDLDTARRLVTALREQISRMIDEAQPVNGEHTVFLDDEHERMTWILYERRKLAYEQEDDAYNEEYEFDDVFTDFVQGYLGVAWDMAHDEDDSTTFPRRFSQRYQPPTA